ncbi:MAG TPA: hydroxymethylglutaryl-CoA reductase [Saprospiraceae bacterium]|jgi:hydroxymethylglutaryl-CoA reductase
MAEKTISGFSKLSKMGKIKWLVENFFKDPETVKRELASYLLANEEQQRILDGFSENTISNYPLPLGIAPNFLVNGVTYVVPMVTEESSVVAAAASGAKFWLDKGGIHCKVLGTIKTGQVHFLWYGSPELIASHADELATHLVLKCKGITANMDERGGGIKNISLLNLCDQEPGYYQLLVECDTRDSMGANFINSVLECFAEALPGWFEEHLPDNVPVPEVIMSILSNYTPDCRVHAWVEWPVADLGEFEGGLGPEEFARRFYTAVRISHIDPYRATTHNKGIFNGIDAVVLATANDFRAVEACGHTWAARSGKYKGLSKCSINNGTFRFELEIPLAVGTVGGLTTLHPLAKRSLEMLGNPDASTLMQVIAATGLMQNFSAIRSLVTTGIQKGHMRMHLHNMLLRLEANEKESTQALKYFEDKTVSFPDLRKYIQQLRNAVVGAKS